MGLFKNKSPNPKTSKKPGLGEVFKHDLNLVMDWIFSTTERGGIRRRRLFILTSAILWAIGGASNTPLILGDNPLLSIALYPFQALFAAAVIRHVILMVLVFWLALQVAANYLDDVFEINNVPVAEKYILQASLANRYDSIEISEGRIRDSDRESPVILIGGPGLVKMHLDSAALFEKFDGEPTVIAPTDGLIALDRFERIRKTVFLRDHIDETEIMSRTRDGINVIASGVRIKYHIDRDGKVSDLKTPFPFDRKAVHTLVFKESNVRRIEPKVLEKEKAKSDSSFREIKEFLALTSSPFQSKLRNFVASSTLSEFLARISEREIEQQLEETDTLEMAARSLSGETDAEIQQEEDRPKEKSPPKERGKFYTREEITKMIYSQNDPVDRKSTGLELDWIDIGTWEFPKNAEKIAGQHRDAWLLSLDNLANKSPGKFSAIERESGIKAIKELLAELVITFQLNNHGDEPLEPVEKTLHLYRQKLMSCREFYEEHEEETPEMLIKVIQHLDEVLKIRRWV